MISIRWDTKYYWKFQSQCLSSLSYPTTSGSQNRFYFFNSFNLNILLWMNNKYDVHCKYSTIVLLSRPTENRPRSLLGSPWNVLHVPTFKYDTNWVCLCLIDTEEHGHEFHGFGNFHELLLKTTIDSDKPKVHKLISVKGRVNFCVCLNLIRCLLTI